MGRYKYTLIMISINLISLVLFIVFRLDLWWFYSIDILIISSLLHPRLFKIWWNGLHVGFLQLYWRGRIYRFLKKNVEKADLIKLVKVLLIVADDSDCQTLSYWGFNKIQLGTDQLPLALEWWQSEDYLICMVKSEQHHQDDQVVCPLRILASLLSCSAIWIWLDLGLLMQGQHAVDAESMRIQQRLSQLYSKPLPNNMAVNVLIDNTIALKGYGQFDDLLTAQNVAWPLVVDPFDIVQGQSDGSNDFIQQLRQLILLGWSGQLKVDQQRLQSVTFVNALDIAMDQLRRVLSSSEQILIQASITLCFLQNRHKLIIETSNSPASFTQANKQHKASVDYVWPLNDPLLIKRKAVVLIVYLYWRQFSLSIVSLILVICLPINWYYVSLSNQQWSQLINADAQLLKKQPTSFAIILKLSKNYHQLKRLSTSFSVILSPGMFPVAQQLPGLKNQLRVAMNVMKVKLDIDLGQRLNRYARLWSSPARRQALRGGYVNALSAFLGLKYPCYVPKASAIHALMVELSLNGVEVSLVDGQLFWSDYFDFSSCGDANLTAKTYQTVSLARQQLYLTDLDDDFYSWLLYLGQHLLHKGNLTDANSELARLGMNVNDQVPALFTDQGWRQLVRPALVNWYADSSQVNWALTLSLDAADLNSQIGYSLNQTASKSNLLFWQHKLLTRYKSDYLAAWGRWVDAISVEHGTEVLVIAQLLNQIIQPDSTYWQAGYVLFNNVIGAKQLTLASKQVVSRQVALQSTVFVTKSLFRYIESLQSIAHWLGKQSNDALGIMHFNQLASDIFSGKISTDSNLFYQVVKQSQLAADNIPGNQQVILDYLLLPIKSVWQEILFQISETIQLNWNSQVKPFYTQHIAYHFPFNRNAIAAADLKAVKLFLSPSDGILPSFYKQQVAPWVVVKDGQIKIKHWLGLGVCFSPNFMLNLKSWLLFSKLLYQRQGGGIGFNYQLSFMSNPYLTDARWVVGDHYYHYHNGPESWVAQSWWPDSNQTMRYMLIHTSNQHTIHLKASSYPWALWQLFSAFEKQPVDSNVCQLTYRRSKRYHSSFLIKLKLYKSCEIFKPLVVFSSEIMEIND